MLWRSDMLLRGIVAVIALSTLAFALPACALDPDEGSDGEGSDGDGDVVATEDEALTTVDRKKPIVLFYGMLQRDVVPTPKSPKSASGALTERLRTGNVENVLVTNAALTDPEIRAFKGRKAYRAIPAQIPTSSVDAAMAFIQSRLAEGYAYVAVDEIEPTKAANLTNTEGGPVLAEAMRRLESSPATRSRVILFVNAYNMAGTSQSDLGTFSAVLRACRDTCRVLGSEVYLHAREAFVPGTPEAGGCATGIRCIAFLAAKLDAVAPGLAKRTVTVLDVRGRNLPGADLDAYCGGPRGGALRTEIREVRELGQAGVGAFALTYVASDLDSATERSRYDDAVKRFTTCFKAAVRERPFARGG